MKLTQLDTMMAMQESMNLKVHADWRNQGFNWHRAIWLEAAEAMEHTPWKWWKKGAIDVDQVKMELVDIWHFILSAHAERGTVPKIYNPDLGINSCIKKNLEILAHNALSRNTNYMTETFFDCLYDIGMSFDEMYRLYVGKNVLNMFRQNNGYKDGTYVKIWGGLEDNQHLTIILEALDSSKPDYKEAVYESLDRLYKHLTLGEIV